MRPSATRDAAVGLFLLGGLGAAAYLSLTVGGLEIGHRTGLIVFANFNETGGLKPRAPIVISGVRVGRVESIDLNDDYRARVTFDLDPSLQLPVDTSASIVTAGLLGDRYVSLQPGGEEELLKSGDEVTLAESAIILERFIGKLVHSTDIEEAQ